ncbi:hypothetical protein KO465_03360 [Candidatus Micrarchaeota archaeon]|jgi:hypothetical protein|nr:hypothetical protein [Candidatus Micrarchaeota archaeon]
MITKINYDILDNETKHFLGELVEKFGEEEVGNLLNKKIEEFSHLIPLNNAIKILYFNKIKQKSITSLKDLFPGIYFVNVKGVVTNFFPPKLVKNKENEYTKYSFAIDDATSRTIVVSYDEKTVKDIVLGSILLIKNGFCRYSKIYINKKTEIKVLKQPKFVNISDLGGKTGNFNVICTVVSKPEDVPYSVKNKTQNIPTFKIADKSGTLTVTIWTKNINIDFNEGSRIRLENIYHHNNEIKVNKNSRIVVIHNPLDNNEVIGEFSDIYLEGDNVMGIFGKREVVIPLDIAKELFSLDQIPTRLKLSTTIKLKKELILNVSYSIIFREQNEKLYVTNIKKI